MQQKRLWFVTSQPSRTKKPSTRSWRNTYPILQMRWRGQSSGTTRGPEGNGRYLSFRTWLGLSQIAAMSASEDDPNKACWLPKAAFDTMADLRCLSASGPAYLL